MADNGRRSVGGGGTRHIQQSLETSPVARFRGERKEGWSRGPRSLFLTRCDNGFGFTLRHFIVYPPESYTVLQRDHHLGLHHGHQGTALDEPMDTIFVKNVRENSPAHAAGLATGDRIISVNGQTITGHTYAQVVQLIQQSGSFLHLLVVPKEDDILQLYFGETAHNPETNQRPRLKSPDVADHRHTGSMLQHHLVPQPTSHHHHRHHHLSSQQRPTHQLGENIPDTWGSQPSRDGLIGSENRGTSAYYSGQDPTWYRTHHSKGASGRRNSEGTSLARRETIYSYTSPSSSDLHSVRNDQQYYNTSNNERRVSADSGVWAAGQSVNSVFKPLQILDERRPGSKDMVVTSGSASLYPAAKSDNCQNLLSVRHQMVVTPTPSSDSMASSRYGSSENVHNSSNSLQGLYYPGSAGCRLSLDGGRRESSVSLPSSSIHDTFTSDGSKDSLLSYDSSSTLTGGQEGCSSDDSLIISRIRKSFEQKEEFLRRPNQPISWNLPENINQQKQLQHTVPQSTHAQAIIAREFYARPQKFQRPVWPPQSPSASPSPCSYRQQSPSRASGAGKTHHSVAASSKPTHQSLQRVKSDIDCERDPLILRGSNNEVHSVAALERAASEPCEDYKKARGQFICGGAVTNIPPPNVNKGGFSHNTDGGASQFRPIMPVAGTSPGGNHRHAGGKTAFVTTLSRIHENIPASDPLNDYASGSYTSTNINDGCDEPYNCGTSSLPPSLPSSPIADSQQFSRSLSSPTEENPANSTRYPQHPMLQLVSRRARQFETGVLDEEESPSDRTSLYRSELSRLTAKKSVPNVAVRKREFESRAGSTSSTPRESRRPNRESRSLESAVVQGKTSEPSSGPSSVSGNQMIPIGGRQLHCEPPHDFQQHSTITEPPPSAQDDPSSGPVKLRARSNSAESWAAAVNSSRSRSTLEWPPSRAQEPEPQRHKAVRQDSYLAAVRTPVNTDRPSRLKRQAALSVDEEPSGVDEEPAVAATMPAPPVLSVQPTTPSYPVARPTQLPIPYPLCPAELPCESQAATQRYDNKHQNSVGRLVAASDDSTVPVTTVPMTLASNTQSSPSLPAVVRRQKTQQPIAEEERLGRRESYLKATCGDRMHVDSDLELSDCESPHIPHRSGIRKWRPPLFPEDIQRLKRIFEEMAAPAPSHHHHRPPSRPSVPTHGEDNQKIENKENLAIIKEGYLQCKVTMLEGKRAPDRSWKQVWASLYGPILYLGKEKRDPEQHSQSPLGPSDGEYQFDTNQSQVTVAGDYTKRKNVLRLNTTTGSEVLLQAEDSDDMTYWLQCLGEQGLQEDAAVENKSKVSSPQASTSQSQAAARLSPLPSHKGIKKLTALRNRSPTGQSPVNKNRKPSQTDQGMTSPKTKTWKGRVARQFRRMQHSTSTPSSPTTQHAEGVTIGIPLEDCPASSSSIYVPLLVELCTGVVDNRGLDVVGIYRVPGNTAAVSALTEIVNRGFEPATLQDPRWNDVNVISSLLKLFFRKLPDALLTSELYPNFIEADKIENAAKRMMTLKKLIHELPEWHFETLKHLLLHLQRVVEHSTKNKMEARNLAIVFGPTLVRTSENDMVTMVTDMSHQCRIVESLINHVDWIFAEDEGSSFPFELVQEPTEVETPSSNTLLLSNIRKVQGLKVESPSRDINAKDLVTSIISAANRKIQKSKTKKTTGNVPVCDDHKDTFVEGSDSKKAGSDLKQKSSEISSVTDETPQTQSSAVASSIMESVVLSGHIVNKLQTTEPECSQETDKSNAHLKKWETEPNSNFVSNTTLANEEGTIRTYAGLSATTQERIRRFEQETKAMLQRDQTRHRHELERREADKLRIEQQWQQAKRDLEVEDHLDKIADNPSNVSKASPEVPDDASGMHILCGLTTSSVTLGECNSQAEINPYQTECKKTPRHGSNAALSGDTKLSAFPISQEVAHIKGSASYEETQHLSSNMSRCASGEHAARKDMIPKMYSDDDPLVSSVAAASEESQERFGAEETCPKNSAWENGSDLLASLTSTFDRKLKSLLYPTTSSSEIETVSCSAVSESTSLETRPSCDGQPGQMQDQLNKPTNTKEMQKMLEAMVDKSLLPVSVQEASTTSADIQTTSLKNGISTAVPTLYRDPSLHRGRSSPLEQQCRVEQLVEPIDNRSMESPSSISQEKDRGWGRTRGTSACSNEKNKDEQGTGDKEQPGIKSKHSEQLDNTEKTESTSGTTRLKRSESLTKAEKQEITFTNTKLKRSESLTKAEKVINSNTKLRRSESLTKAERADSPSNTKLKRSDSLTKTEKTESNNSKRKQDLLLLSSSLRNSNRCCNKEKENVTLNLTKLKRKNGMPERSIKRRHTVGGTKDFDKLNWLDNRLQQQQLDENETAVVLKNKERQCLRTSSPDLSSSRLGFLGRERFLVEIRMLGSGGIMAELRQHLAPSSGRPHSLPDPNLASRVFKVPLESHV